MTPRPIASLEQQQHSKGVHGSSTAAASHSTGANSSSSSNGGKQQQATRTRVDAGGCDGRHAGICCPLVQRLCPLRIRSVITDIHVWHACGIGHEQQPVGALKLLLGKHACTVIRFGF